jgi:2,3-dihydroxybiphenyl 1,2-dioxygenase
MPVTRLGYLGFETAALDTWKSFGPDVLGLAPADGGDDETLGLRMDDHPARLVLHAGQGERLTYIGWEVSDLADLRRVLETAGIDQHDASDEECARRGVNAMVQAVDPAGHRLEFVAGVRPAAAPFANPRGLTGFRTGELGLGHVVVHVADLPATVAFYRDVLDFRLRDYLPDALYFLGCNARHHSIGIAHIAGEPRVLHVMLEVDTLDDVGRTFDACIARGVRVSTLGLHTNDRMTSFYLQTPSGWEVEYGWNGLLVDDATWQSGPIERPSIWGHHQLDPEHPPGVRPFRRAQ